MFDAIVSFLGSYCDGTCNTSLATSRKKRFVHTNTLCDLVRNTGCQFLCYLKPETIFVLKLVSKDMNKLINDDLIEKYGENLFAEEKELSDAIRECGGYKDWLIQELQMSFLTCEHAPNTYYRIEVEVLFGGLPKMYANRQDVKLEELSIWNTKPETYTLFIKLHPVFDPSWLRESKKPRVRRFGPFKNTRLFNADWGDKVVLQDYEEIFLFLTCKTDPETEKVELIANIKDYILDWTYIESHLHMMEKESACLLRGLFKIN